MPAKPKESHPDPESEVDYKAAFEQERTDNLVLRSLLAEANETIERLQKAKDAGGAHIPAGAGSIPAPATISPDNPASVPDDDPNDPRPEMDPARGWRTPEILDWAARQCRARYSNLN